jgi:hypothetical protein
MRSTWLERRTKVTQRPARARAPRKSRASLEEDMAQRKAARSGDSCGCAMGARFMVPGLLASAAWYGWQLHAGEVSFGGAVARVLAVTFVATSVGKIFGILRQRWQGRVPRRAW